MIKKTLFLLSLSLLFACGNNDKQKNSMDKIELGPNDCLASLNLTVAQSKKLIAEGIANDSLVKKRMESGMIIITRGTTNTYIAERLMGLNVPHGSFMTGNIIPVNEGKVDAGMEKTPEIVLVDGKVVDMDYATALSKTKDGDIIFKGANLLNYERGQAAVLIGLADGGTTGKLRPYVGKGKAVLYVPVGLEKEVYGDLNDYERLLAGNNKLINYVPKVWVHKDPVIFTEIESIKNLAKVKVFPLAAGGIAGREGGISLVIAGDSTEINKVLDVVAKFEDTEPFIKSAGCKN